MQWVAHPHTMFRCENLACPLYVREHADLSTTICAQIGLAYMDINTSKVFAMQTRGGPDLAGLSSTITACGLRECLLPAGDHLGTGSAYATIAATLERCGVKATQLKKNAFQVPNMETEQVRH